MGSVEDLTGKKFGRLTVVKRGDDYVSPRGQRSARWICECECGSGKQVLARGGALKSGSTKSCGCISIENTIKRNKDGKKYNRYDLSGEYGIGYTFKGEEFYFDLEDYNKIKDYCWHKDAYGYIVTKITIDGKRKGIKMHRLIMGMPDICFDIDHIHGDKTRNDNRKSNLRIVTKSQNSMNKKIMSNNTSGVTGVGRNKSKKRWTAYIVVNNKQINLGVFDDINDAIKSRKAAEEKYFGEYSYDNSMKMGVA